MNSKPVRSMCVRESDLSEPLKRWDWTPIFWHSKSLTLAVIFAYFSTGDHAQAANQVKMAQILELTYLIRTPFVIAADFNMEPDRLWEIGWVQSLGQRPTLSCQRWGRHVLQVVGESLILLLSQTLCNLSGGEAHLSTIRHANHSLAYVCSSRQLPHSSA